MEKTGCMICGEELVYQQENTMQECHFCGKERESNVACPDGHFICDHCHSSTANDVILEFCKRTEWTDPVQIAMHLMENRKITMHGPEHHFLVPAALLTTYYNLAGKPSIKKRKIFAARQRAEQVLGGFCGSHGNCGAGVGTGIFMSLVTGSTPLAVDEWRLSNMMTSRSLYRIALSGGPRCCKRDTFIAIREAVSFLEEETGTKLPSGEEVICGFPSRNRQCTGKDLCEFHPHHKKAG